jgi:Zn-dependent alcohol dehydrogenase
MDLYLGGQLNIDDMIAKYSLDKINDAYDAMRKGTIIRGAIVFE